MENFLHSAFAFPTVIFSFLLCLARFAFLFTCQPANFNTQWREPVAEVIGVLFSQQLGRRHQRDLLAVGDGAQCCQRGHQVFTRTYIPLQ